MTCVIFNEMCNVFVVSSYFEFSPGRKKLPFFFLLIDILLVIKGYW